MLIVNFFLRVTTSHAEEKIHIEAAAALLFDADTGKILHEQNPDELLAIASMSKLIVVYAVLEAIKEGKITWDTKVNILITLMKSLVIMNSLMYRSKKDVNIL